MATEEGENNAQSRRQGEELQKKKNAILSAVYNHATTNPPDLPRACKRMPPSSARYGWKKAQEILCLTAEPFPMGRSGSEGVVAFSSCL